MGGVVHRIDDAVIRVMRRWSLPLSRLALFVVYFWFGILKVLGHSPASAMVAELQLKTLPFISTDTFLILFGLLEMFIGIAFLIPRAERVAIVIMAGHMVSTMLPLVLMPSAVWTGFLVPTLEGQYIIKNLALIAIAAGIAAQLIPLSERKT
jgi:uncharacterized membrane protein YkgB